MTNREELKRAGLRAYETGRLRVAARAAWVLVPTALLCALETGAGDTCACLGALLLGLSVFFRWRDRRGTQAVRDGLVAGVFPLMGGLLVARVVPDCAGATAISVCSTTCLGMGLLTGIWLGARLIHRTAHLPTWLLAFGIAALAASLGCAGLGLVALIGTASGLGVGMAVKMALRSAST